MNEGDEDEGTMMEIPDETMADSMMAESYPSHGSVVDAESQFTQLPSEVNSDAILMQSLRGELFSGIDSRATLPSDPPARGLRVGETLGDGGALPGQPSLMLWGTTVDVQRSQREFSDFLRSYREPGSAHPGALYMALLRNALDTEESVLNVDSAHLREHSPSLYHQLVLYPQELLGLFNSSAMLELAQIAGHDVDSRYSLDVRPYNLVEQQAMRLLDPTHVDQLVSLRGMVVRCSNLMPHMEAGVFRCQTCAYVEFRRVEQGRIREPEECPNCRGVHTLQIVHNLCTYSDKQLIKLQETPEAIPEGETPHTINLFAYRNLVDVARPGDRVEITGIYRASAQRFNPAHRQLRSIYRTYVDCVHVRVLGVHGLSISSSSSSSNPASSRTAAGLDSPHYASARLAEDQLELERRIRDLARMPDIYERLARSLAPSIWELDDLKKGVLCLLFGGSQKEFRSVAVPRCRGEIHVLLCGDPGTSKSQMLAYIHKIAPRGIYTSGKGSSAVGLTAYVTKDAETRQTVLESGALVLSDRGVCLIDEFDKMSDHTRSILHEAMEQQTVSVAKAGIICTLNARTSILASANPAQSRYNPSLSVVENLQLPPTLLSRFDLIFLVLDKPSAASDRRLADHMVSLYFEQPGHSAAASISSSSTDLFEGLIPVSLLTQYITYARERVHPRIGPEAAAMLQESYVEMRRRGFQGGRKTVAATPRQLESMIRLSEALAKIRLADEVSARDVQEARRLMLVSMQTAAMDPRTGTIDMDLIQTGRSSASREEVRALAEDLKAELRDRFSRLPVRFADLADHAQSLRDALIPHSSLRDAVSLLHEEGSVDVSGDPMNIRPHSEIRWRDLRTD